MISNVTVLRRQRPTCRRRLDIIADTIAKVQKLAPAIDLFAIPALHKPGLRKGEGANAITYYRKYQDGHYEIQEVVFDDEFLATATEDELQQVTIHEVGHVLHGSLANAQRVKLVALMNPEIVRQAKMQRQNQWQRCL